MKAFKVTTHDYRPPVQGGEPIFDGTVPYKLPPVEVDEGPGECKAGWNACRKASDALRIAGLWPNGRPSILWEVETTAPVIERDDKLRAETWNIIRRCREDEVERAVREMWTGAGLDEILDGLVREQMLWREALARPFHDEQAVVASIHSALDTRGLAEWTSRKYESATDAWNALIAWGTRDDWGTRDALNALNAWNARDALNALNAWADWADWAARAAWDARAARAAWAAKAAWDARAAWADWSALKARDAWSALKARDAWSALNALVVFVVGSMGWTGHHPYLLTTGIRDAYYHGASIVLPLANKTIGYAMVEK